MFLYYDISGIKLQNCLSASSSIREIEALYALISSRILLCKVLYSPRGAKLFSFSSYGMAPLMTDIGRRGGNFLCC